MKQTLKRIRTAGGMLSPNEMKQVINYAEKLGLDHLLFGSRQDIILPQHEEQPALEAQYDFIQTEAIVDPEFQNISCSYVSADIFSGTPWLQSSTYLYILESFRYKPTLKINICDPHQRLTPLFSGELNFVASAHEDYWYLMVDIRHWLPPTYFPVLIYSWDIAKVSEAIEAHYADVLDMDGLFELINKQHAFNHRNIDKALDLKFRPFPYYEGMNKMGINQYWLGLYWRNNKYDLDFLKSFCDFCIENGVGKICLTTWKSFIVKGIPRESKLELEKLLGRFGINVRHSLLELNWHLPVDDDQALALKKYLVMNFDQNDISTYGLTFGITEKTSSKNYFTSIVIERNPLPQWSAEYNVRHTYNILYATRFDPNSLEYKVYAQDVDKLELPGLLMELSVKYFDQLGRVEEIVKEKEEEETILDQVYQCGDCMTLYEESIGDPFQGFEAGLPFEELPDSYCCGVCGNPKANFASVQLEKRH